MSAHTPGPWSKKGTQIRKGDFYLASSRQSGLPPEQAAANARLIAAAPELLEALKALHTHTKNNHCICGMNTQAEQAIAKAEGRE